MKRLAVAFAFATLFAACSNNAKTDQEALNKSRDSIKMLQYSMKAYRDSLRIDSLQKATAQHAQYAAQQAQIAQTAASSARRSASSSSGRTYVKGVSENYYATTPATTTKKRGWSAAAKGTAIGAGAGALTGVLVDKKNGRGAIVGGLLGAGTGYVIGRAQDKKSGRAQ